MPASNDQPNTTVTVPWSTGPLTELMTQLSDLVRLVDEEQYNIKPESTKCGAIGGHVRHTLDHLVAWLGGIENGMVNYDDRVRDTVVENDPVAALNALKRYTAQLAAEQVGGMSLQEVLAKPYHV